MSYLDAVMKKSKINLSKNIGGKPKKYSFVDDVPGQSKSNVENQRLKDLQNKNLSAGKSVDPSFSKTDKDFTAKAQKRKRMISTAIKAGTDGTSSLTNTNKKSPRYGQTYALKHVKGGDYHTYENGVKVFVRKNRTTLPKKGQTGGTYKYLRSNSA